MPPVPAAKPAAPAQAPARRPAAPAPAPAKSARGPQAAAQTGEVAPGVLELKGLSTFTPPAPIADFLDARKMSTVNVRFGSLAQGPLEVRTASKGKYRVNRQPIPLTHPAFARVSEYAPSLAPALIVGVQGNKIEGQVGLTAGAKAVSLADHIQKTPEILGLMGFTISTLPKPINQLEGGSLHLGLTGVPIKLGAAFKGTFSFDVVDDKVTFDGSAAVDVQGLANGTLDLKRTADGAITGKAAVALTLPKNFSGAIDVAWDGVAVTGMGKVGYKGEKFSGEVTLYLMEKNVAKQLAEAKKAPEGAAPQAAAAKDSGKKPSKIAYVVFGEGDLSFAFTEWLNGTAHVIADPNGNITVIGKITPQKEFILFEQKDYVKQLFKIEARASYGIPVVGSIGIFGNASMDVFAKLGPAKFYNIVIEGTYSTDPKVAKNFSIRGSLNISAAAGARLRAEVGAVLTILAHDIKAGAGVNGIAGVKAYAEATPIIGYREKAAEGQDKKGEWFIRGDLEVAAQPFLGLSGDLFVEIDAPWWSPVPDKKWTWPLFNKEWPLGGTMGMLVSVDYVFGSGQWPKFDFKPVAFDSSKFMTNLYEDKAKSGSGKEVEQKGKWAEKNSAAAEPPAKTSPKGNAAPGKATALPPAKSKPLAGKKGNKTVDPNAKTKEGKSVKQLQDEATKKGKKPEGPDAKGAKGDAAKKDRLTRDIDQSTSIGREKHTLRAHVEGGRVRLLMASNGFHDITTKVREIRITWVENDLRSKIPEVQVRGRNIETLLKRIEDGAAKIIASSQAASDPVQQEQILRNGLNDLRVLLSQTGIPGLRFERPKHHYVGHLLDTYGRATAAAGDPISSASAGQGSPSAGIYVPGIMLLNNLQRGHLLADLLGGPGSDLKNLTPIPTGVNTKMRDGAEKRAGRFIYRGSPDNMLRYIVRITYRDISLFKAWLQQEFSGVLPNAAENLFNSLKTGQFSLASARSAMGMPTLSTGDLARLMKGLAYYFLAQHIVITIDVLQGKGSPEAPIPNGDTTPNEVLPP